jgi:DNA-binding NarL/FixJ family response regulator
LAIATKKILSGGHYISTSLAEKLVANLDGPVDKPLHELLSDREHEVMRMIAAGVPLTDIGERLHVSVKTISTYRSRIMEKMHMKSNAELTRYAMTQGLID